MNEYEKNVVEMDYKVGEAEEEKFFNVIKERFIVEKTNRYEWYDFILYNKNESKIYLAELKKRNNNKNTFTTTIIPYYKIEEWKKVKKDYEDFILIFDFLDGRYYITWKQIQELIRKGHSFKIKKFQRHKGFFHNNKKHLHIPVKFLKPFEEMSLKS